MKMTTLMRRSAAAALAVTTLAAGVSLGGPAATAVSDGPPPQRGDGAEARYLGGIKDFSVEAKEDRLVITASPYCYASYRQCDAWVRYPGQERKVVNPRGGWSTPWPAAGWQPGTRGTVEIGFYVKDVFGNWEYGNPPLTKSVDRPEQFVGLTATVDRVDQAGKSVTVSGNATKNAEIRRNGSRVATSNGRWTASVSGLQVGQNVLTFEQWVNNTYRDSKQVAVTIDPPAPTLTATGSFPADIAQRAQITGVAAKGATVVLRSGGAEVGRSPASAVDGSFAFNVPAPDAGGGRAFTVSQIVSGTESGNVPVTLNYGAAVSITSPDDGADADPGPVTISGTGENGSSVTLSVNGSEVPSTTVSNGSWTRAVELRRGENTIVATQKSKGANTTVSSVVVNPGESSIAPLVIESPADNTTIVTSSKRVEFSGTAETGAHVQVFTQGSKPRTIIDTYADDQGAWKQLGADLAFGVGYTLDTVYTPRGEVPVRGTHRVTLQDADPGVVQPFAFTTPPNNSTVIAPNGLVRLAGAGTTGTEVTVWNYRSKTREVGTATVGKNGQWEIPSGEFNNQDTRYELHVEYTAPGQVTQSLTHVITVKAEASTELPYVVETPSQGSDVTLENYRATYNNGETTISGTGKTGGKVKVWNYESKNRIVIKGGAILTVDENGKWTGVGELTGNQPYALHIEYFAPGADPDGAPTEVVTRSFNTVAPTK